MARVDSLSHYLRGFIHPNGGDRRISEPSTEPSKSPKNTFGKSKLPQPELAKASPNSTLFYKKLTYLELPKKKCKGALLATLKFDMSTFCIFFT